MPTQTRSRPVFIACCARSGSTLLRFALDSHPEISAPPELHLLRLTERLAWTYCHTGVRDKPLDPNADPMSIHNPASCAAARDNVEQIMAGYLDRTGKQRWVEKSISTVDHLGLLHATFADAQVLFLYRSAPGVMGSCHALPPEDATGFEFDAHLAREAGNRMDGLAAYWLEKTDRLLSYQNHIGDRGHSVRYEDLILRPAETLAQVFDFIGVNPDPELHEEIFQRPHQVGPGDPKIHQTRSIERKTLSRGSELPLHQLSARKRRQINVLHQLLGYPEVTDRWNPSESDLIVPM